jgi:hypothetical protein
MGVNPAVPDIVLRFPVLSMTVADQSVFDLINNFVFVEGDLCVSCGAQYARQKALTVCMFMATIKIIARLKIVPNRVLLFMLLPFMANTLLNIYQDKRVLIRSVRQIFEFI